MSLNLNVLAQAAQLLQDHTDRQEELIACVEHQLKLAKRALQHQSLLIQAMGGELAVYRMMEQAIATGTWEEEADGIALSELLRKVRAEAQEAQSKFFSPAEREQMKKSLDEKLAEMHSTSSMNGSEMGVPN